jgi:hypothetical protein
MILKRGFIDCKRLTTIGVNNIIRSPWLLDYVKCLAKPLEYSNNDQVIFNKTIANYVLYNGQKLTLKTFIDDFYDISDRRTIIDENKEEGYSLYGYNDNGKYYDEVDPNQTTLNGYTTQIGNIITYHLEADLNNPTIYGYVKWEALDALQDVDSEYILDNIEEYIYTSDNSQGDNRYLWFLEGQLEEGLIIYLHNDIYTSLTTEQLDTLFGTLDKYILSPNRYKIEGYN